MRGNIRTDPHLFFNCSIFKNQFMVVFFYTFESSSSTMVALLAALLMLSGCMATELSDDVSTPLVDAIHFEMP